MPALRHQPGHDAPAAHDGAAPTFTLTADGGRLALADLRGKVVAVTFIYASCVDACPLLTAKMAGLDKRIGLDFGAEGLLRRHHGRPGARHAGRPAELRAGARRARAGWAFLTGSPEEIRDVAQRYGVFARKTARGDVDHTFLTSVVDHHGALRVQYIGIRFSPDELLRDLQLLLRESGRIR